MLAVAKDGTSFRAINSAADVGPNETLLNSDIPPVMPPPPNIDAFVAAIKSAMGGIVAVTALVRQYPTFYDALTGGVWADVEALLVDAKATSAITVQQYTAFQTALAANNIPVTLP